MIGFWTTDIKPVMHRSLRTIIALWYHEKLDFIAASLAECCGNIILVTVELLFAVAKSPHALVQERRHFLRLWRLREDIHATIKDIEKPSIGRIRYGKLEAGQFGVLLAI
ncbi:hypothetical protein HBI38_045680 [Parastagonospora nodorum]|nr:hypothetical protein HBH52_143100 [Parastagonospora nodorum]KAH3980876.1 hypothetical protein HBH51_049030 [Parastagonospora nodorum]KAH4038579.1 hypothetical protein HBI09_053090 [Parastagonospora nodorum]KAH4102086.1 hypothetical protein HBH46_129700 [Parastagonospora nodorum]KAH4202570.1 hypothetical protein HBH42_019960 [Parastagonospora nodorum]